MSSSVRPFPDPPIPSNPPLTQNRVIALAGLRLYFLHMELHSTNPYLHGGPTAVSITQIQIGYSILASIVPCLKNFMAAYDAPVQSRNWYQHYGTSNYTHELASVASKSVISRSEIQEKSGVVSSPGGEEVIGHGKGGMEEYTPGGKKGGGAGILSGSLGKLRPEPVSYEAHITHKGTEAGRSSREGDGGETRSVDSGNSRRMIIKKGVEWSVNYDARGELEDR